MYVSRLNFQTLPGNSDEVAGKLSALAQMVEKAGGIRPRILRTHFASPGAPGIVFEQEAEDLAQLESQIREVTEMPEFQSWTGEVSPMLSESPRREIYIVV